MSSFEFLDGTADDDRIVVTDENFPPKEDFDFEIKQKDQYLKRTTDF